MSEKLIFSLDVGSSKVVALIASIGVKSTIIGMSSYHYLQDNGSEYPCISNGVVCDIELTNNFVTYCLHEAQEVADCSHGSIIANISGSHVHNIYAIRDYTVNGATISHDLIQTIIRDARHDSLPQGYEILDYEVQEYLINDDFYAQNPIDLARDKVTSHINLFVANKINLANLTKAITQNLHHNLIKIVPSAILSAYAVLTKEDKLSGCCLLDIGAATTDIVVYENGYVRELFVLPLGGNHIINDIKNVLKISRSVAEELLLNYGYCGTSDSHKKIIEDRVKILNHRSDYVDISTKLLHDVIEERVREILHIVKKQLKHRQLYDIISSGVILTGGVAQLEGITNFASKLFDTSVKIGIPIYDGEFVDVLSNPKYATAIGAIKFAVDLFGGGSNAKNDRVSIKSIFQKIKHVFKNM